MGFEEMSLSWRSFGETSLLAVDTDALHASVRRKSAEMEKQVEKLEWVFGVYGFFLAPVFITDFILHAFLWPRPDDSLYQHAVTLFLVLVCAGLGLYGFVCRRRRRMSDRVVGGTLLDSVGTSLLKIERYTAYSRIIIWFCMLPLATMSLVNLTFFFGQVTPWAWGGTFALCLFSFWEISRDIRERLLPERRSLEYLRGRLLAEDS